MTLEELIAAAGGDAGVAAYFRSMTEDETKALTVGFMLARDVDADVLRAFVLYGEATITTGPEEATP